MRFQTLTSDATIRAQALANLEMFRTSLTDRQAEPLDSWSANDVSPRAVVAKLKDLAEEITKHEIEIEAPIMHDHEFAFGRRVIVLQDNRRRTEDLLALVKSLSDGQLAKVLLSLLDRVY